MKSGLIDTAKPGPTFDGESMRAILDGRKTQTRRVLKGCREGDWPFALPRGQPVDRIAWQGGYSTKLPYVVGGVYYARESLIKGPGGSFGDGTLDNECCIYKADGTIVNGPNGKGWTVHWPWKCQHTSSFAMPRWAARVFLRITDVRVQRLGEISDTDIAAEIDIQAHRIPTGSMLRKAWVYRWERVNKPGSWERDRNKWVAAYTFEVLKGVA